MLNHLFAFMSTYDEACEICFAVLAAFLLFWSIDLARRIFMRHGGA